MKLLRPKSYQGRTISIRHNVFGVLKSPLTLPPTWDGLSGSVIHSLAGYCSPPDGRARVNYPCLLYILSPIAVTRSVTGDKKNQNFKEQSPRAISGRLAILPARAALASVPAYVVIIYNFLCLINRQFRKLFTGINLGHKSFLKTVSGHLVFVTRF